MPSGSGLSLCAKGIANVVPRVPRRPLMDQHSPGRFVHQCSPSVRMGRGRQNVVVPHSEVVSETESESIDG